MTKSMWCSIMKTVSLKSSRMLADELGQLIGLLGIHAGSRFVQQQQLTARSPAHGRSPRDAARHRAGEVASSSRTSSETQHVEQLRALFPLPLLLRLVHAEGGGEQSRRGRGSAWR